MLFYLRAIDMEYSTLRLPQKVYLSDIVVYICPLYWITQTTVLNVIKCRWIMAGMANTNNENNKYI